MEKLTNQTNNQTYRYQDNQIEVLPYFLYAVDICIVAPKISLSFGYRYYTSNKLLNVKEVEVIKRFNNFNIERFITLLGATISFIKENNLSIYELKKHEKRTY